MKNNLRITAAQIDTTIGDIQGNTKKIINSAAFARDQQKSDIVVFPELTITGYPPEDLLLREELYEQTNIALQYIVDRVKDIYVILGLPTREKGKHFNSAVVIYNGKILATYHKQQLPNYGIFDEKRYFTPGTEYCILDFKGVKTAIIICEDLWIKDTVDDIKKLKPELIISLNASPFDMQKHLVRENMVSDHAKLAKTPIIYVNCIGGQDEMIFDGGSLVVDAKGNITQHAPFFAEDLMPIDIKIDKGVQLVPKPMPLPKNIVELVYKALVLGVRDYIEKNEHKGAIVSVSGGIDSALTLAIAVDALGKDRVESIYLPSRYSSKLSTKITEEESKILGVKHTVISIEPVFKSFLSSLPKWKKTPDGVTRKNLQARCRGTIMMAFSNQNKVIVLSTGNRSETAVGYTTLYGDMVGGFCVLKDVPKTLVYKLAKYRNKVAHVIPEDAITRAPTAELAKDQKDTDDLPEYEILDEILRRYIELNQPLKEIVKAGFDKKTVAKIMRMVNTNEYKRRQAPPGIKITTCSFGSERRYPITSKFDKTRPSFEDM